MGTEEVDLTINYIDNARNYVPKWIEWFHCFLLSTTD